MKKMPLGLGLKEKPSILIVDDEPDFCWLLSHILKGQGYRTVATTSGEEALKLVRTHYFDAAFVDAKLRDADGIELCRAMQELCPSLTVVIVSGYFYPEDREVEEELQHSKSAAFVAKPFDVNAIREAARKAVQKGSGQR